MSTLHRGVARWRGPCGGGGPVWRWQPPPGAPAAVPFAPGCSTAGASLLLKGQKFERIRASETPLVFAHLRGVAGSATANWDVHPAKTVDISAMRLLMVALALWAGESE